MNDYWMSDDDIKNDMLELSDFSKLPQPAPEPSEFMKKLRGKPSIFEDNFEEEIEEQPVVEYLPVRGHPLLKNGIRKPGGRPISHEQHTSAHTDIREVSYRDNQHIVCNKLYIYYLGNWIWLWK